MSPSRHAIGTQSAQTYDGSGGSVLAEGGGLNPALQKKGGGHPRDTAGKDMAAGACA